MNLRVLLAAVILLAGSATARGSDELAPARRAVERGLPFLEKEGVAWMTQKGCVSCHHVPFMLWSHNEARAHGVAVDEKKLAEWTDWSWKFSRTKRAWYRFTAESVSKTADDGVPAEVLAKLKPLVDKPFTSEKELVAELGQALTREELDRHQAALVKRATRPLEPENDGGGLDTLSQFLLGRARGGDDAKKSAQLDDFAIDVRDLIVRWQQPDGSWKAAGQLPALNRPAAETNAVTTRWTVLALGTLERPGTPAEDSIKRALDFLGASKPGVSNESLVVAMLVERRFGQADRADVAQKELLGRQNADGGWAWRQGGASDAFATGQALYALRECGLSVDAAPIARARDYLIQSQTGDGSWSVPSNAISSATKEARLTRLTPIYRYWGTGWAVIGLSHALPEGGHFGK